VQIPCAIVPYDCFGAPGGGCPCVQLSAPFWAKSSKYDLYREFSCYALYVLSRFIRCSAFCRSSSTSPTIYDAELTIPVPLVSYCQSFFGFFSTLVCAYSCSFWAGRTTVPPNTYLQGYHNNDRVRPRRKLFVLNAVDGLWIRLEAHQCRFVCAIVFFGPFSWFIYVAITSVYENYLLLLNWEMSIPDWNYPSKRLRKVC
jgi:hypothetical protein